MRVKIILVFCILLAAGIAAAIFCFLRFGFLDLATIGAIFVALGSLISILTYLIGGKTSGTYDAYDE